MVKLNTLLCRVHDGKPLNTPDSSVKLVYSDGCRDPAYSTLAPASPWRENINHLVNNFDFRVFMFEDMQSGDSIVITAKVVACVEEADCRTECYSEAEGNGVRRRRRREVQELRGKTDGWARAAIAAMDRHGAEKLVAEVNQGGDLVESVVRQIDPLVPFKALRASRGKGLRAEPVAALYEQGRVKHLRGALGSLEDQMCQMTVRGFEGRGSPDRLDALVWRSTS